MKISLPTARTRRSAADRLRREVLAGLKKEVLEVGGRLLAERKLAGHLGVSYMTARRAVGLLVDEGLLERRPRQGVFVAAGARRHLDRSSQTGCVRGLFYLDQFTDAYGALCAALGRALDEAGREIVWSTVGQLVGPELPERLAGWNEDAFVVVGPVETDVLEALVRTGRPVTVVDHLCDGLDADCAVLDNEGVGFAAATRLFEAGHERVAYVGGLIEREHPYHGISGRVEWPNSVLRAMGVRRAYVTRGRAAAEALFCRVDQFQGARALASRWFDGPAGARPSAAVAFNSIIAAGLLVEARARGVAVPERFAAIGMGTPRDGWTLAPTTLAHYGVDWAVLGREAARLTLARLADPRAPRKRVVLPWRYVPGTSGGPD